MTRRILPLLALFALLVAPFGMAGGAAAMPLAASEAATEHCEDMAPVGENHGDDKRAAIDCTTACAALPAIPTASTAEGPLVTALPAPVALASLAGTFPEADPPPPRTS